MLLLVGVDAVTGGAEPAVPPVPGGSGAPVLDVDRIDGVGDAAFASDLFLMRTGDMKRRCSVDLTSGRWFSIILPS